MSSCRLTSVARPAQYTSTRSDGSSGVMAEQYVSTSPVPTTRPAARSSRANPTSTPANGATARSGTGGDLRHVLAGEIQVVTVLDDSSEGVTGGLRGEVGLAEEAQRAYPVDGLCHPWGLGQVKLAQPVHG